MKNRRIISPMPRGSGAYIVHRYLEQHLRGYHVVEYNPYWTLLPIALPAVASIRNADLIHTVPDYAVFFRRQSKPIVISFQNYVLDSWMDSYSTFIHRLHYKTDLRLFTRSALMHAHTITAVSNFTADLVRKDMKCNYPIKIIYNGVDTEMFFPLTKSKMPDREINILFSGNLTRRKGADIIAELVSRLSKQTTLYYTQGLMSKKPLPDTPGLKCLGSIAFEDMSNLYRQMDILWMPTVREGFSLAVLEAMACGLPVVASDCSSLPEQIDDGKGGFLCPVGDVNAFSEKINLLANSPKMRREMGEYNRAKVEKMFTLDRMVKEYKELFESVLA